MFVCTVVVISILVLHINISFVIMYSYCGVLFSQFFMSIKLISESTFHFNILLLPFDKLFALM